MKRQVATTLEYALLGLLHQQGRSGYDLRKIFETTAMGNYSGSPGAIYPALRRLEERGLIEGEVDSTVTLRPRKLFRPTEEGSATLCHWLALEIRREDVERHLDELMLRFAFHWVLDDATATRGFLSSFAREIDSHVRELKRQLQMFADETPLHPRLALAAGIQQYQACARWARGAIEQFAKASA